MLRFEGASLVSHHRVLEGRHTVHESQVTRPLSSGWSCLSSKNSTVPKVVAGMAKILMISVDLTWYRDLLITPSVGRINRCTRHIIVNPWSSVPYSCRHARHTFNDLPVPVFVRPLPTPQAPSHSTHLGKLLPSSPLPAHAFKTL